MVKKKEGNIVISDEEITMRWEEYLKELYEGNYETTENYMGIEEIYCFGEDEIGPSIMNSSKQSMT